MTNQLLSIENLSFRYRSASLPALDGVEVTSAAGQVLLVVGPSGCGKSTLLRCVNGLIPRSYRGELAGRVLVDGQDVGALSLRDTARLVGTVLQDPERQIVASYVAEEVAFGPENLGWPRERIRAAVATALGELGIEHLAGRETFRLSGGEKQKVALAGLLAMDPRMLLLDEPLASLDPLAVQGALEVIRSQAERGRGVLLVEHRVDDALSIEPDQALLLHEGRPRFLGRGVALPEAADPLLVKLPAPAALARRPHRPRRARTARAAPGRPRRRGADRARRGGVRLRRRPARAQGCLALRAQGRRDRPARPQWQWQDHAGQTPARPEPAPPGRVRVAGQDTRRATTAQLAQTVGYIFQSPTHMLFAPTVREELGFGPRNLRRDPAATTAQIERALTLMNLDGQLERAPLSMSFGQQKRLGIAAVLAMQSRILVMDEPTAGQDYASYTRFMDEVAALGAFDALLFVTHDLDLALTYANRILLFHDGQLAADGPPERVLADAALLRPSNVLPTSLLELNLQLLPRTGRLLGLRQLAAFLQRETAAPPVAAPAR